MGALKIETSRRYHFIHVRIGTMKITAPILILSVDENVE